MILFLTENDRLPPGTQTPVGCGFAGGSAVDIPAWTYSSHEQDEEFSFPADDGAGTPVGQIIPAGRPAFVLIHYLNASDSPATVHVELNGFTYDADTAVTRADSYVTFNGDINIPGMSSKSETFTCNVPAGAKFFSLSTHSHKQSVHTYIRDNVDVVFESTDFAHPGSRRFDAAPFFTFASGQLTYQCDYVNPNNYTIQTGDNVAADEMCDAVTFYFPSPKPRFCYNGFLVP
jgi:hypothetical protein